MIVVLVPAAPELRVAALQAAVRRASYLATWCGAARFKRARAMYLADLVVLELFRSGICGRRA